MRIKYFLFIIATLFLLYGCSQNNNFELKTKSINQEINQVSMIGTKIGEIPPDFTLITTEGKAIVLEDFLRNKNPVIIYFFTTWCPYCRQDLTALSKVYKDYEDKVSTISISLDLSEDSEIIRKYKTKYPDLQSVMFAPGTDDVLTKYQVIRTTTKIAIGQNGTITYAGFGAFDEDQWKALLSALVQSGETKTTEDLPVTSESACII